MRAAAFLVVLLGTGLVAQAQTARRVLTWDYARTLLPPVLGFRLAAVDARGAVQQFQVPPSDPGACGATPPEAEAADETFCTTVACPPGGNITAYWIQAATAAESSAPSNILTCWTPPNTPACPCLDPSTAPPGQGLPPFTPPVLPPVQSPLPPPPLSSEPPPLPQRTPEGLNLQAPGPLPELARLPAIPASAGT